MRVRLLAVSIVLVASGCLSVSKVSQPTPAPQAAPFNPADAGRVDVRVSKSASGSQTSYGLDLAYENTSSATYLLVRFRCRFVDPEGYQVGVVDVVAQPTAGPFRPGFKGRFGEARTFDKDNLGVRCEIVDASR